MEKTTTLKSLPDQQEPITPHNVLALLDKISPLTPEERESIEKYLQDKNLVTLLSGVTHQETFFTAPEHEQLALLNEIRAFLQQAQVTLIDTDNNKNTWLILLPGNKWLIKRTKVHIARQNVLDTLASIDAGTRTWAEYGRILTKEEWLRFQELFEGRTYQAVSRAMIYLLARRGLDRFGITNIRIPVNHLIHLPGRPEEVNDGNYVVIEEYVPGTFTPLVHSSLIMHKDILLSLVKLIFVTGWWTISEGAYVVNEEVYYTDHELPNRHDIRHVAHRDQQHFRELVELGWRLLREAVTTYANEHTTSSTELIEAMQELEQQLRLEWTQRTDESEQATPEEETTSSTTSSSQETVPLRTNQPLQQPTLSSFFLFKD